MTDSHIISFKETKWGNQLAVTKTKEFEVQNAKQVLCGGQCTVVYLEQSGITVIGVGSDPNKVKQIPCD